MAVVDAWPAGGSLRQQLHLNADPADIEVSAEAAKHNFVLLATELEAISSLLQQLGIDKREGPCHPIQLTPHTESSNKSSEACHEDLRLAKMEARLQEIDYRVELRRAHLETLSLSARAAAAAAHTEPQSTPLGVRSGTLSFCDSQAEAIGESCKNRENQLRIILAANPLRRHASNKQLQEIVEVRRRLRSASPKEQPMLQRHASRPESLNNTSPPSSAGAQHRRVTTSQTTLLAAGAQGRCAGVQSRLSLNRAQDSQSQMSLRSNNSRLTNPGVDGASR
eukprot:TRINITY_DN103456_c0_g1_i1.p1 TRINITY_DN103456_c0_g1~~TRINITY_DN103456_c0_g1_i1.p1  ORF type:complete len:300 (-),score=47.37 TRINITY_DN103456_c0_g1_i1:264-1103(-)